MTQHEFVRKDFANDYERDQREAHHANHRRKNVPALVFRLLSDILGEYRDERDAQRTARDQVIQEIRQRKSGVVGISDGIRAHLMRDCPVAKKSENAAEQNARHYDSGGRKDAAMKSAGRHDRHGRWFVAAELEAWPRVFPSK